MPRHPPVCGNPLFLTWVEELRDQARERGSKAYESYSKAVHSLSLCPITYTHPRELVVMAGIGAKTVSILEGKWRQWCEENGVVVANSPEKTKTKGKGRVDDGTHSEASDEAPVKKRKPSKPKPPKRYIPAKGSGGYGILLALVLAIDAPLVNTQVFLTRSDLIRAAQPYSDSSYDHSSKGGFHTAWNSMKTLVGKGYVYVTGNPHKYCLTEEGYEVACAIRALLPEFAGIEKQPFLHSPHDAIPRRTLVPKSLSVLPPSPPGTSSESSTAIKRTKSEKFQFWYIDSMGNRVVSLSSAMIRLDPETFVALRKVEFRKTQRHHPFVKQLKLVKSAKVDGSGQPTLYGFVDEEAAPPTCSRFEEGKTVPASRELTPLYDDDRVDERTVTEGPAKIIAPLVEPIRTRPLPRLSSQFETVHPLESTKPTNLPDFSISQSIVFPAKSYEIVLILDTREVESKHNRDRIAEKLLDKGVKVETRALRLGDVCWIARRIDGMGGEEDECVLDYVLERKRLDDLCSSIKDGRYTEQCHRLSNSGISRVFYLVEDFQTSHLMEFSGKQIMSAKSQLQVHKGFILKETHKLSETIDFLATMTRVIRTTLSDSPLHVIPTRYLSRSTFLPLKQHLKGVCDTTFLTSFDAYQELNDKSASVTLRDQFAKMLLCVKGMSAERVSAVLEGFETPREMWDELKKHSEKARIQGETERRMEGEGRMEGDGRLDGKKGKGKKNGPRGPEMFFADRVEGVGRRKIGDALSKEMYKMFMGDCAD